MIYNLSNNDTAIKAEINKKLGKAFGLVDRFRMGGNGSPSLIILDADDQIKAMLPDNGSINKCNIELRPNGLIIGFKRRLETFGWVIPYHFLSIFKSGNRLSFYAGKHHLIMDWRSPSKGMDQFLIKLLQKKADVGRNTLSDPLNDF